MKTARSRDFCEMLGIRYPIIQAPMAGGVSTPALCAAVSEAGGLGSLAAGYLSPAILRQQIDSVRQLTDRPFQVNLFIPQSYSHRSLSAAYEIRIREIGAQVGLPDIVLDPPIEDYFEDLVQVCVDERVSCVSWTFGLPSPEVLAKLRSAGCRLIGTATSPRECQALDAAGCDAIALQGYEAGGHRGTFLSSAGEHVGLISLLETCRRETDRHLIASGGLMTGGALAAVMLLGASAGQFGTAFLLADQSGADIAYKNRVLAADPTETVLTKAFSGKWARGIRNSFVDTLGSNIDDTPDYPLQNAITAPVRAAAKKLNNTEYMSLWSGQSGSVGRMLDAGHLLRRITEEADAALSAVLQDIAGT